ncbi:MAG: RES domain-containing protein [Thermoleophilaceae bacterium]
MRHVRRGGEYLRIADPDWGDPLSPEYARRRGGRWNPPGSFGVVYLNASLDVARAQVRHKLEPRGIRPEDLVPDGGPILVRTDVPDDRYVDAISDAGLVALGLPLTYPRDDRGRPVQHAECQPIGRRARDAGERGIACRSAAETAPLAGEELAFFVRQTLQRRRTERFADWYW